ncbi:hypothetical protein O988_00256 [Pseudogymnoascus sp. VKM F-3808]|nr:hypothetical protein O988_00256 [Pseudogymnoascus sp. VKM F-3808]
MKFGRILPLFAVLTSVIAQLYSDRYYIRALAYDKPYIGRFYPEDKSLRPKPVGEVRFRDPELWLFQALPNGRFILNVRGDPTGVVDDLLYAFLVDQGRTEEWVITRVPEGGPDIYTIQTSIRPGLGWVAPPGNDERQQIQIRPLLPGPPQVSQLFQLIPYVD